MFNIIELKIYMIINFEKMITLWAFYYINNISHDTLLLHHE